MKLYKTQSEDCPDCTGTDKVPAEKAGDNTWHNPCSACNGTGKVPVKYPDGEGGYCVEYDVCDECEAPMTKEKE